jgi:hypothetical protein
MSSGGHVSYYLTRTQNFNPMHFSFFKSNLNSSAVSSVTLSLHLLSFLFSHTHFPFPFSSPVLTSPFPFSSGRGKMAWPVGATWRASGEGCRASGVAASRSVPRLVPQWQPQLYHHWGGQRWQPKLPLHHPLSFFFNSLVPLSSPLLLAGARSDGHRCMEGQCRIATDVVHLEWHDGIVSRPPFFMGNQRRVRATLVYDLWVI